MITSLPAAILEIKNGEILSVNFPRELTPREKLHTYEPQINQEHYVPH